MARLGTHNYLHGDEPAAVALPGRRQEYDRQRQFFVDAGRVFMLWGWSALLTAVVPAPGDVKASGAHAFLGLLLWLSGVCLVALEPAAARRFPWAARVGAAAASAVVAGGFLRPWNEMRV